MTDEKTKAAMIEAAVKYLYEYGHVLSPTLVCPIAARTADFALAQTADLREQLRVAKEALVEMAKRKCSKTMGGCQAAGFEYEYCCGSCIALEALARLDASKSTD